MGNFKEDIAHVRAFVLDVDGVLTDGGIIPIPSSAPTGDFLRKFNAKDGYAVSYALKMGYHVAVITGGRGEMLAHRLKMLGVKDAWLDCTDKIAALEEFLTRHSLNPQNVIYIGDDIPDLECMRHVGIPVSPADAAPEIIDISRYVSQFNGGHGCVRDVIEQTLRAQDTWALHTKGVTHVASR